MVEERRSEDKHCADDSTGCLNRHPDIYGLAEIPSRILEDIMIWILPIILLAVAPIWRVAGSKEGYPAPVAGIKHLREAKHIPVEEAIRRAREAYRITHYGVAVV